MTIVNRVLLTMCCVGLLISCGCGGNVAAPTAFVEHNAKDGSYLLQVPEGWTQSDGGRGHYHRSTIKLGGAKIDITSSEVGSIMLESSPDIMDESDDPDAYDYSALGGAHHEGLEELQVDHPDLTATKAEKIKTALGDGRRSEITYPGSLGGMVFGYFATINGHNNKVTVICTCSESNWESLKPAFTKAIDTLARGRDESLSGG